MSNLTGRQPYQKTPKCDLSKAEHTRHLEAVKSLSCCVCGAHGPSDAHHVICGRYGTRKPCDCMVIPLCKQCHTDGPMAIHSGKQSWILRNGYDYDYLDATVQRIGLWT